MVGIKPEIVKRAEANRIGVLILRKSFAVPSDGAVAGLVFIAPGRAAIALVVKRAVV